MNDLNIPIKVGFQAEFLWFLYSVTLESKSLVFRGKLFNDRKKFWG